MIITQDELKRQPLDVPALHSYPRSITIEVFKRRYQLTHQEISYCLGIQTVVGTRQISEAAISKWINKKNETPVAVLFALTLIDSQWTARLKHFDKHIRDFVKQGRHRYDPRILTEYEYRLSPTLPSSWVFNNKVLVAFFWGEIGLVSR